MKRYLCLLLAVVLTAVMVPVTVGASLQNPMEPDVVVAEGKDGNMCFFPDIVNVPASVYDDPALPNGKLLVAFYKNKGHAAAAPGEAMGTIWITESTDNGLTWSEPRIPVDVSGNAFDWRESKELEIRDPNFALLNDGTILLTFFTSHYGKESQTYITRSVDGGATWDVPEVIQNEHLKNGTCAKQGSIAVFDDDEILVPLYGTPAGGNTTDIVFVRSKDKGKTWIEEKLFKQGDPSVIYNEAAIVAMGNKAYAFVRNPGYIYESTDRGETWTQIAREGSIIHQPCLVKVDDSSIFATWTVPPEGGSGKGRPVRGKLFYPELGWDATTSKTIYGTTKDSWDMGDASTIPINDGRFITVYYDSTEKQIGATFTRAEDWDSGLALDPIVTDRGNKVYSANENFNNAEVGDYPASGRDFSTMYWNSGDSTNSRFQVIQESEKERYFAFQNNNPSGGKYPCLLSKNSNQGEFGFKMDFRFPDETPSDEPDSYQHVYIDPRYQADQNLKVRIEKQKILAQLSGGKEVSAELDFDCSKWYSLRMAVMDSFLGIKVWERGTAEPAVWTLSYNGKVINSQTAAQLRIGYLGRTAAGVERSFYLDNVEMYKSKYLKVEPESMDLADNAMPQHLTPYLNPAAAVGTPGEPVTAKGLRVNINDIYRQWELKYRVSEIEILDKAGNNAARDKTVVNMEEEGSADLTSNMPISQAEERSSKLTHLIDGDKGWWTCASEALKDGDWKDDYFEFRFRKPVDVMAISMSIDGGLGRILGIKNIDIQIMNEAGEWVDVKQNVTLDWKLTSGTETLTIPLTSGKTGDTPLVLYASESPEIASVSLDGMVTPHKAGETKITVEYPDYNTVTVPVEVHAATASDRKRLSVFLIAGQSNAYGAEGNADQSVRPDWGTTYLWNNEPYANYDEDDPYSMESTYGTIGDSMTELLSAEGREGFFGAFADEWSRRHPDETLLLVNTSFGGSSINGWIPDAGNYRYTKDVFAAVYQHITSPENSARFELGEMGYLWLQGEKDLNMSTADYVSRYTAMHNGFLADLGADGHRMEFGAIMMVRAGSFSNQDDIRLNGPRVAQYWMHNQTEAPYDKIHLVTNITDQWDNDAGVANYFKNTYPGNIWNQMGYSYAMPTTRAEVHPDIHYRQPGYNELGKDAARNLSRLLDGGEYAPASVELIHADGKLVADSLNLEKEQPVVPLARPLYSRTRAQMELTGDDSIGLGDYYVLTPPPATEAAKASLTVTAGAVSKSYQVTREAKTLENPLISGKGNRVSIASEDLKDLSAGGYPAGREFDKVDAGAGGTTGYDVVTEGGETYFAFKNKASASENAQPNLVSKETFSGEFGATFDFRFPDTSDRTQYVYISPMYSTNNTMIRMQKDNAADQNKLELYNGGTLRGSATVTFDSAKWYSFRMAAVDTAVYAKIWERGTEEPKEWMVKYENYTGIAAHTPAKFRIGYQGKTNAGAETKSFYVDNLNVFRSYYMEVTPSSVQADDTQKKLSLKAGFAPNPLGKQSVSAEGIRFIVNDIYDTKERKYRIAEIEIYDTSGKNVAVDASTTLTTNIKEDQLDTSDVRYGVQYLSESNTDGNKNWRIMTTKPLTNWKGEGWEDHVITYEFGKQIDLDKVCFYCDDKLGLSYGVKDMDIQVKQNGEWVDQRKNYTLTWPQIDPSVTTVNLETIPLVAPEPVSYLTDGVRLVVKDIYQMWQPVYRISEVEIFDKAGSNVARDQTVINMEEKDSTDLSSNMPLVTGDTRGNKLTYLIDGNKDWWMCLTPEQPDGAWKDQYIQFSFRRPVDVASVSISIDGGLGTVQGVKNLDIQILNEAQQWVTIQPDYLLEWQNTSPETIKIPLSDQLVPVEWSSDNPEVVTVAPNGVVLIHSAGETVIRASYGQYNEAEIPVEIVHVPRNTMTVQIDTDPSVSTYLAGGGSGAVEASLSCDWAENKTVDVYLGVYDENDVLIWFEQRKAVELEAQKTQRLTFDEIVTDQPGRTVKIFTWDTGQEMVPTALPSVTAVVAQS